MTLLAQYLAGDAFFAQFFDDDNGAFTGMSIESMFAILVASESALLTPFLRWQRQIYATELVHVMTNITPPLTNILRAVELLLASKTATLARYNPRKPGFNPAIVAHGYPVLHSLFCTASHQYMYDEARAARFAHFRLDMSNAVADLMELVGAPYNNWRRDVFVTNYAGGERLVVPSLGGLGLAPTAAPAIGPLLLQNIKRT